MEDEIRELIRRGLKDRHLSMSKVSKEIGRNHAYLHQFLNQGKPVQLPEDAREKLAPLLGLRQEQLKPKMNGKPDVNHIQVVAVPEVPPGDTIPIMGVSQGGPDGYSLWNGEIVEHVRRPPQLVGVARAYGVYVTGTSMEPRYNSGEMLYIHPGQPCKAGDYVLVQIRPLHDGDPPRAVVKRLVKQTGLKIVLEQLNPPKTIDVAIGDLVSMHRIVGSGDPR